MTARNKRTTIADIKVWLLEQPQEELIKIIMDRMRDDGELFDVLSLKLAAGQPRAKLPNLRGVIADAMVIEDYVTWRETSYYYDKVERVLERLKGLLSKHPAEVVDLAEYGMECWEEAIWRISTAAKNAPRMLSILPGTCSQPTRAINGTGA